MSELVTAKVTTHEFYLSNKLSKIRIRCRSNTTAVAIPENSTITLSLIDVQGRQDMGVTLGYGQRVIVLSKED